MQMNKQEYDNKKYEINAKAEANKRQLAFQYAFGNAEFNEGDKITDTYDPLLSIEITKRSLYMSMSSYPLIAYKGYKLKKDGTRYKSNETDTVISSRAKPFKSNKKV